MDTSLPYGCLLTCKTKVLNSKVPPAITTLINQRHKQNPVVVS